MMNGRPLSMRKKVQLLVILTLLAWATQTLFHQWGFGADVAAAASAPAPATAPAQPTPPDKFVPGTARFAAGATLELRGEATVYGPEVKLKQLCRWSARDAAVFAPVSDLVLARIPSDMPFQAITLEQVRATLHDAGVNLGVVKFSGPTACTITRSDVKFDEQEALLQWARAKEGPAAKEQTAAKEARLAKGTPAAKGEAQLAVDHKTGPDLFPAEELNASPAAPAEEQPPVRTLRDLLVEDLSTRLHVPANDLELVFNPRDEHALRLAEPQFKFNVEPRRVRNLGAVAWDVQIVTEGGKPQKTVVSATARAWQHQVVLAKPVAFKQVIRDSDVTERRLLVDSLDDDPMLSMKQVVGQQAARQMAAGTVLTAKTVQAVPLARAGQFITITLSRGGVRIKTVGRAMEEGSFGQTIKVKNESTKDVYQVVLTGPQEGTMGPVGDDAKAASARVE
jgi:flagella basal body P-ring formation protein FlgA